MIDKVRTETVKGEIIQQITCEMKIGLRVDYRAEGSALFDSEEECGICYGMGKPNYHAVDQFYEDNLYEYSYKHIDTFVKEDEWTGAPHLYSNQRWYEMKLKIGYKVHEKIYEKIVNYESITNVLRQNFLYVTVKKGNPENICFVSENNLDFFLILICIMIGLVVVFVIVIVIWHL